MNRRDALRLGSLAVAGAFVKTGVEFAPSASAAITSTPQWPGHKPGRIYVGVSSHGQISETISRTGPLGLQRTYYRWNDASRETSVIKSDHAAARIPWISFKPPFTTAGGWRAVASGNYDADIRARARRYAALSKPVIITFNHEPHNDSYTGTPAEFAQAWTRIYDVMKSETGLRNVASVPIIGDWAFNPINRNGNPETYITSAVLSRCSFLGIDLYQNQSGDGYAVRLGRILKWLDGRGHPTKMVGLGETGATDDYGTPSGAKWWTDSWNWAAANRHRVAAISYFNSQYNNNSGNTWLLWESTAKLNAFKASVQSPVACRL